MWQRDAAYWRDVFWASDPDYGRLRTSLRAVFASAGAALLLLLLSRALVVSSGALMTGVTVAMIGSTLPLDPGPRAQWVTMIGMVFAAAISVAAGTLTAPYRAPSFAAFAVTIFLAIWARRFGPGGGAVGMVGFMSFFSALFFHARLAELPVLVASVAVGVGCVALARFFLVPEGSASRQRAQQRALRAQAAVALAIDVDVLERGWSGPRIRRARRAHLRLNEIALGLEETVRDPAVREWTFEFEAAVEHVGSAARVIALSGTASEAVRRDLIEVAWRTRERVRGENHDSGQIEALLQRVQHAAPGDVGVARYCASIRELLSVRPRAEAATRLPAVQAVRGPAPKGLHPATRQAIQATIAGALATVAGFALSKDRWVWAVIAAFVVFTRTSTVGETVVRAWERIFGTVVGISVGLVLARVVHDHRALELSLVFGAIFFAFYFVRVSYALFVAFFTALLAVLYSLLGHFTSQLLYLRLEETLIGAGLAALVSAVVMPTGTRSRVRVTLAELLRQLSGYLEHVFAGAAGDAADLRFRSKMRALDVQFREVREVAMPLTQSPIPLSRTLTRQVHATNTLLFYARQIARTDVPRALAARPSLRGVAFQVAQAARTVAEVVASGEPADEVTSARVLLDEVEAGLDHQQSETITATHALRRIDEMLLELHEASRDRWLLRPLRRRVARPARGAGPPWSPRRTRTH